MLAQGFGSDPLASGVARLVLLAVGLVWLFVLSMSIVRREGDLRWRTLRRRLRLNTPRDPRTGRPRARLWLWVVPFLVAVAVVEFALNTPLENAWVSALPFFSQPRSYGFDAFFQSQEVLRRLRGAWWFFALFVSLALLAFGTSSFPDTLKALGSEHPMWQWPTALLNFFGFALFALFLYVFPDGRFVPRWTRWVTLVWILWQLPQYWYPGWDSFDLNGLPSVLAVAVWTVALGTVVYSQVQSYRRFSDAVQRRQIEWVVLGVSSAAVVYLGMSTALSAFAPAPTSPGKLAALLLGYSLIYLAMFLIPSSIGIAILRYRLFDIDLIINRTLVYGTLTASIVVLYVVVVGGLGQLLQVRGNALPSLVVTGLAAVFFRPLRERLQRAVNRLVYGERDEPYVVLSRLGSRLEATLAPDAVLPAVAQTVREALKLPYAEIQLKRADGFGGAGIAGHPVEEKLRLPLIYREKP